MRDFTYEEYIKLKEIINSLSEDDVESGRYDEIISRFNEYQRNIWGKIEYPQVPRFSSKQDAEEWLKKHLPLRATKTVNNIKTTIEINDAEVIYIDTSELGPFKMITGERRIIEGERYYTIRWGKEKTKIEKLEGVQTPPPKTVEVPEAEKKQVDVVLLTLSIVDGNFGKVSSEYLEQELNRLGDSPAKVEEKEGKFIISSPSIKERRMERRGKFIFIPMR